MARILRSLGLAASILASTTLSLTTFTPISSGPSFSVGIPSSSSSISASSNGALYIRITAPTSYQWVGFGIVEQMQGAKIFVVYADGNGNVTVSARDGGQGHVMPEPDDGLQAGVRLLEGSGIVDGNMVANFRCDSSTLQSSKDSTASPFIAAWMQGSSLDTTSLSTTIRQHSGNSYRQVSLDLSQASITSDSNPFLSASSSDTPTSDTGGQSGDDHGGDNSNDDDNGGSSSSDGGSSGSNGGATVVGTSSELTAKCRQAHGIIMGVTAVLLFPIGAMFMRLGGGVWVHGALQLLSLCALLAGFGLGIKLGQITNLLYENSGSTHTIFGTVIVALFLIQPFFGIFHHLQYRKSGTRTPVSHLHIWYGRIIMVLGIINGGLGLKLAANSNGGKIAYGVVAGVVGLAYVVLVGVKRKGGSASHNVTSVDGAKKRGWGRREKADSRDASS